MDTTTTNYVYDESSPQVPVTISMPPEDYILLNLRFSALGNKAKGDKNQIDVDADKSRLSLSKKLLDCKELEAIDSLTSSVGKWLLTRTFPANRAFKHGFYAVPPRLVSEIDNQLLSYREVWEDKVSEFLGIYETAKYRASLPKEQGGLGVLYNPRDYLFKSDVRAKFNFSWSYFSFSVPPSLSPELQAREREALRESLVSSLEECRLALRTAFVSLIDRATDRLKSTPDGKAQRFTFTLQEQLQDFLAYFADRNSLAQDNALPVLVAKAKNILVGCPNFTALRDNAPLRETIQAKFAGLQAEIDNAKIVERPSRAISLGSTPWDA
jgi:hypothetical protein